MKKLFRMPRIAALAAAAGVVCLAGVLCIACPQPDSGGGGSSPRVNKTELGNKITEAEAKVNGVVVSADGAGLSFGSRYVATQAALDDFNGAINAAKNILNNGSATQLQVNNALAALTLAVEGFTPQVVGADKTALNEAIAAAQSNHDATHTSVNGSEIPTDEWWATAADKTTYQSAINDAKTVRDSAAATQNEVDQAIVTLGNATTAFNGEKTAGTSVSNKTDLNAAISAAQSTINSAAVSTDGSEVAVTGSWVTQGEQAAYQLAIGNAQTVAADAGATQSEVDAALAALNTATGIFNNVKKSSPKRIVRYMVNSAGTALENKGYGGDAYQAALKGPSTIKTVNGLRVVDVGNIGTATDDKRNCGVDLGAAVGQAIYDANEWSIETFVYVPAGTNASGSGRFLFSFAKTELITSETNAASGGTFWMQFGDTTIHQRTNGWNSPSAASTAAGTFPTGRWKHVVVTAAADGTITLYVDGTSTGTMTALNKSTYEAWSYNYLSRSAFAGNGDNPMRETQYFAFSMYNVALASGEIESLRDEYLAVLNRVSGGAVTVTFTNAADEALDLGTEQTLSWLANTPLTLNVPAGYAVYEWYLNGAQIAGANGTAYTLRAQQCPPGTNHITALVKKGAVSYTKDLTFKVE